MSAVDFRYEYKKIRIDLRSFKHLPKHEISSHFAAEIKSFTRDGWSAESDSEWFRLHRMLAEIDSTDDFVFVLTFCRWNPK